MTEISTIGGAIDLVADSRTPCILKLAFHARDLSAATFTGEVRQNPNEADGVAALASFVFTPVLVTVEAGETISRLMAVLDEASIEALPAAGAVDAAAIFHYDIHVEAPAKERVCGGKLTVSGGVTND